MRVKGRSHKPSKPESFSFSRVVAKATGLWFAAVGGATAMADLSDWLDNLIKSIKSHDGMVAYLYMFWLLLFLLYEGVRWRLRWDLYDARQQNRRARRG